MRVLISGHVGCLDRGYEALVRTTCEALAAILPDPLIRLPSPSADYDREVLRDAACRLEAVPRRRPPAQRVVGRLQRIEMPRVRAPLWPAPIPRAWRREIAPADLVIALGGDGYSPVHGAPSGRIGLEIAALRMRKPVVLWSATVGPFDAQPAYERALARMLPRFALVTACESESYHYLRDGLGVESAALMMHPAFELQPAPLPEGVSSAAIGGGRMIGINLSARIAQRSSDAARFAAQAGDLIRRLLANPDNCVVLIPYAADSRRPAHGDSAVLERALATLRLAPDAKRRLLRLPDTLCAAQYMAAVRRCHALLAAHTRLAIAGFALGVPTVSLGYSRQARGLNRDIYGDTRLHLPAAQFSAGRAAALLDAAQRQRAELRERSQHYVEQGRRLNRAVLERLACLV